MDFLEGWICGVITSLVVFFAAGMWSSYKDAKEQALYIGRTKWGPKGEPETEQLAQPKL